MRAERRPVALVAWAVYFLRLGTLGFGGPIALTAAMQRDLVEARGWFTSAEYLEGLALAQLAFYLGWVRWRVLGATVTALAFVGRHSSWCWSVPGSTRATAGSPGCSRPFMASAPR
jgi:hypothetical protein